MNKIFFTSDSHFGHKNIVRAFSDWTDKSQCRDFPSVEDMNNALVTGINSVVGPDDTLYHLGDFNFGGIKNQERFRRSLACNTIHLILGNHDFNHGSVDYTKIDHGFASITPYREIMVEGQEIILCHYAMRVWNRQNKGSWMLYGHSHGSLPELRNFSMDVGVEGTGKFDPVPWSFAELKERFKNDVIAQSDHHDRNTNSPPLRNCV